MDLKRLEKIKKLAIISVFSDDSLMETLVLKGGNALDIIYKIAQRASIDLDFSIEKELDPIEEFTSKISNALRKIFGEEDFEVFDINISEKPKIPNSNTPKFWGGYKLEFKIIEKENHSKYKHDISELRRNSSVTGLNQEKTFSIDISKWEYCAKKQSFELEGYTIYVYSPEMIVFEKIRAICQQMPEYIESIDKSYQTARARDFFDIYVVLNNFDIKLTTSDNIKLLKLIFKQKSVDLNLINNIKNFKEFHKIDFLAIQATVKPKIKLKDFDYYFDYVVNKCDELYEALGKI